MLYTRGIPYRALFSRASYFANMCKKRIRESNFRESHMLTWAVIQKLLFANPNFANRGAIAKFAKYEALENNALYGSYVYVYVLVL